MTAQRPVTLFRTLTTGVYVIGVAHGGRTNGFTAAWLTQVSFDPLLLALSVNPDHASYPLLRESHAFTVNVLRARPARACPPLRVSIGTDHGQAGRRALAGRPDRSADPARRGGLLDCRVVGRMAAGDHELVVGEVVGGEVLAPEARSRSAIGRRATWTAARRSIPRRFPLGAGGGSPAGERHVQARVTDRS